LTPFAAFFGGTLTQEKDKKNAWYETHQYLNWLFKIEGISLKLKNQKWLLFRPR
jgi:hypothetical protein